MATEARARINLLDEALRYRERDWSIIPVTDKKASVRWKSFQKGAASEATIRDWFRPGSRHNGLAVVMGQASDMLGCRDFDSEEGYQEWAERNPTVARELPTAETGRGRHVYFRAPREDFKNLGDGEYRAKSTCYTVLPPSWHPEASRLYRWLMAPGLRLPEVDPWDDDLIRPLGQSRPGDDTQQHTAVKECSLPPPHCLSVAEYCCVSSPMEERLEAAIRTTIPRGPGQRHQAIWDFVVRLKGFPEYREAKLKEVIPLAVRWYKAALPCIRTKDIDVTLTDFATGWKNCTGGCPVEAIFEEVKRSPPHPAGQVFGSENMSLLVGLCAALQRYNGNQPFLLGCRTAGDLLGISFKQANRLILMLENCGIIHRTYTGTLGDGKANEFLFVGNG
ncbi:hypothetical protein AYO40_05060 [Planctomycetaceae bacterium SCGC AG-212-D15]|nr:hypothetical protein AYO40_05060 [Planctomycetaceae bacterium SCGC AG-212-D15]